MPPPPPTEPEPETAAVTLRATMGTEDGPEVTDPVVWSLEAPGVAVEGEGNPLTLELEAGAYASRTAR